MARVQANRGIDHLFIGGPLDGTLRRLEEVAGVYGHVVYPDLAPLSLDLSMEEQFQRAQPQMAYYHPHRYVADVRRGEKREWHMLILDGIQLDEAYDRMFSFYSHKKKVLDKIQNLEKENRKLQRRLERICQRLGLVPSHFDYLDSD